VKRSAVGDPLSETCPTGVHSPLELAKIPYGVHGPQKQVSPPGVNRRAFECLCVARVTGWDIMPDMPGRSRCKPTPIWLGRTSKMPRMELTCRPGRSC
jgi:hypothetical protein